LNWILIFSFNDDVAIKNRGQYTLK